MTIQFKTYISTRWIEITLDILYTDFHASLLRSLFNFYLFISFKPHNEFLITNQNIPQNNNHFFLHMNLTEKKYLIFTEN